MRNDSKQRILDVVLDYLDHEVNIETLTVREIAEKAQVNLALINYHFGSKDELIKEAVNTKMESYVMDFTVSKGQMKALERMTNFIIQFSDFSFKNYYLSYYAIQHDFLIGSTQTSAILLDSLREHFEYKVSENTLKLISLQIVVPLQHMFLNTKTYMTYLGVDLYNKEQRDQMINELIQNVLK